MKEGKNLWKFLQKWSFKRYVEQGEGVLKKVLRVLKTKQNKKPGLKEVSWVESLWKRMRLKLTITSNN